MTIKIDTNQMTHLKEKSGYNRNYYQCGNTDSEILEICDEDYNSYQYFIVEGDKKTLLGCGDCKGEIELLTILT